MSGTTVSLTGVASSQAVTLNGVSGVTKEISGVGALVERGPAGVGVPIGGAAGQILTKSSNDPYDAQWSSLTPVDVGASFLNVKDYGAIGDGDVDDTSAIQAALNASVTTGYSVYFPAGHYAISSSLTIGSGTHMFGDSSQKSIITQSSTSANGLTGVDVQTITIENIAIQGPGSGTGIGISFSRSANANLPYINIRNAWVFNFGGDGIKMQTPIVSNFERVNSAENGGHGYNIYGQATSTTFVACYANANAQAGYNLDTCNYLAFMGCAADSNAISYRLTNCQGISFKGCGSEATQVVDATWDGTAFKLSGCYNCSLTACWVYANPAVGIWVTGSSANITIDSCEDNSPEAGATAFRKVDTGCIATIIGGNGPTADDLATGTTNILNDGTGNLTTAGALTVHGESFLGATGIYGDLDMQIDTNINLLRGRVKVTRAAGADTFVEGWRSGEANARMFMDGYGTIYMGGSGTAAAPHKLSKDSGNAAYLNYTNTAGPASVLIIDSDNSAGANAESTLTTRVKVSGGSEFIDRFANHYTSNGDVLFGSLIQKTGAGSYRDYMFGYYDAADTDPSNQIKQAERFYKIAAQAAAGSTTTRRRGQIYFRPPDGSTNPSAHLHIGQGIGGATAGSAPLKLDAGTLLTTPEDGAIEYNGTHWYASIGATRYQLDQQQPLDATLTALAAYNTNGLLTQTAADTFTGRTITGTANQILVINGSGVNGNPTISLLPDLHIGDDITNFVVTCGASSGSPKFTFSRTTSSTASLLSLVHAGMTGSSGTQYGLSITNTINQTSTAATTDLLINRTETAVGSGAQFLIDAQVGGNRAFSVNNVGEARFAAPGTPTNYGTIKTDAYWTRVDGSGISGWTFNKELNINNKLTFADTKNMEFNTTTGTKIGTTTSQKFGFWNVTPVVQQVLATGASHTVDDVITLLQTLGLCRQS